MAPFRTLDYGPIQVQVQLGPLDEASMRRHLDLQSRWIRAAVAGGATPNKGIIVLDASVNLVPSATVRRLQADWHREHERELEALVQSMAFVVNSRLVRGAMQAVFWLSQPAYPMTVHASLEAAIPWAIEEAAGHPVPVPRVLHQHGAAVVARDREALRRGETPSVLRPLPV